MKSSYFFIPSAIILSIVATGCRTSVNTTENAEKSATVQYIQDERVVTDRTLEGRVNVGKINIAETSSGIMKAQIELINLKNSIQTIYYTIEWFDGDGMKVHTATGGWKQQQFMARETLMVTVSAPSPIARDFKIKLLESPR